MFAVSHIHLVTAFIVNFTIFHPISVINFEYKIANRPTQINKFQLPTILYLGLE